MRTIDISTTQNVTITYEIASLRDRILATIIDWVAILIAEIFLFWVLGYLMFDEIKDLWLYVVILPVFFFYTLVSEIVANGQTLGKKALRIKVLKLDGKQLTFFDHLLRWSFRLIDIWFSLGSLASILSTSTENGQRLGDLVANSTVVRLSPSLYVTLSDILKINTRENYEPLYPSVRNFKEEDMLLVKQCIERYQRFKNSSHKNALLEVADTMGQKLGLKEPPENRMLFLKTLIKDYIVLTR